jgi:Flp pilus assembly protein TadB
VDEPQTPPSPPETAGGTPSPRSGRKEVQLDPTLQARMLAQMREEQATALRKRELTNWVLVPAAVFALILGTVLMFSSNMLVAFFANTIATGIAIVLWRVNRERIRDFLGM